MSGIVVSSGPDDLVERLQFHVGHHCEDERAAVLKAAAEITRLRVRSLAQFDARLSERGILVDSVPPRYAAVAAPNCRGMP